MASGMRVIKADDLGEGGAFQFSVTQADDVIAHASEHFLEAQAQAWRDIRTWADDQIALVQTQDGGSPNGPGASLSLTGDLRAALPPLWARHHIRSVLDVACGDWNWMRFVDLSGLTDYVGWDIDGELISRCQQRAAAAMTEHPSRAARYPHTGFEVRNVADSDFPTVDCILARHILIHFPNDYITAILDRMRAGNATYLLASNFPTATNDFVYDPTRYSWMGYMEHPVNLEAPPFNLATKLDAIPETPGPAGVLTVPHELALFALDGAGELCNAQDEGDYQP